MKKNKVLQSAIKHIALGSAIWMLFGTFATVSAASLFNSSERMSTTLEEFPKWDSVLERTNASDDDDCHGSSAMCDLNQYLKSIASLSRKEQVDKVNRYHNKKRYIQDITNWGVRDYWETLLEFLKRDGDCEDYAIAKYMSLKHLGFDADDMRIVVLKDENLNLMHSVLAVYLDDKIYILDNQIKSVLEDKRIYHYTPIYSINEHAWWRHLPKG